MSPKMRTRKLQNNLETDMEFVQKFTRPDFKVKNFILSISPYFNSFGGKNTKRMSENGEIYSAGKNFTLRPALTGWTNSTSDGPLPCLIFEMGLNRSSF